MASLPTFPPVGDGDVMTEAAGTVTGFIFPNIPKASRYTASGDRPQLFSHGSETKSIYPVTF